MHQESKKNRVICFIAFFVFIAMVWNQTSVSLRYDYKLYIVESEIVCFDAIRYFI